MLNAEIDQEKQYWTEVLRRIVVIVKKLTSRGLPLRGSDEVLGSSHNGNFLMAVELLAEFDPFLKEHIKNYGRPGSGKTNYLSSTTYEEIVYIMAQRCREVISANVRIAKYFSIIVDSTPDISHVDQLSIVIRYFQECGSPTEVFLKLVPTSGHKSEQLYNIISETLASFQIILDDCRGQSYDNAANMSGLYTGL
ncbi:zinc finger MYM-type protein 1-like [Onthophagus taurus]|uniref:zinc finger MYM-type protein 1-like n=1 Tax=Onthophagus taurus TaxID=166361 RepID=UPI000C1FEA5B|nr:zinc finger MYM-type protein 1-like [Onthophagus taurus]